MGSAATVGATAVKTLAVEFGAGTISGAAGSCVAQKLSKDGKVSKGLVLGSGVVGGFASIGGLAMTGYKGAKVGVATSAGAAGLFDFWMALSLSEPKHNTAGMCAP